ncbi:MAG: DUF1178 family protein [Rhodocyclaceae bacterium]
MIVLNLCCSNRHRFEGWFGSNEVFQRQSEAGEVRCPICGNRDITRLPSNPRVLRGAAEQPRREQAEEGGNVRQAVAPMKSVLALMRRILDESEDVGERFPEEARRIHYEEAPQRNIRGLATNEEAAELEEEGIKLLALPIPPTRGLH